MAYDRTTIEMLTEALKRLEDRYQDFRREKKTNHPTAIEIAQQITETDRELAEEKEEAAYFSGVQIHYCVRCAEEFDIPEYGDFAESFFCGRCFKRIEMEKD